MAVGSSLCVKGFSRIAMCLVIFANKISLMLVPSGHWPWDFPFSELTNVVP